MIDLSTYTDKRKVNNNRDNRGFTLVEMIVVMLIMTVLASVLIPGFLGWIDDARGKKYVLSARGIYMAAQAIESEKYAAWDGTQANANHELSDTDMERIMRMADVEEAVITDIFFKSDTPGEEGFSSNHDYFTIVGLGVQFQGVKVTLYDGIWTVVQ